jgi:ribosome-associated protein
MKTQTIVLRGEFIRLCDVLKLAGLADSGAGGKLLVAQGGVTVDGRPEARKTAQIRAGQLVQLGEHQIKIIVG